VKQPRSAQKIRAWIVYGISGLATASLLIYLLWSLRSLVLPIILGALLAYICKPLIYRFNVRWLPNGAKVVIVLFAIIGAISIATQKIKDMIPSEKEQLVLQVRLQYKTNEKFKSVWEIDPKTGKGNVAYNVLKNELDPFMLNLNKLLSLSPEQRAKFREMYRTGDSLITDKFYSYYIANLKEMKHQKEEVEKILERNPASNGHDEAESKSIILALLNTLSTWLLLPFVFIFLLFDEGQISKFFIRLVPNNLFELTLSIVDEVDTAIGKYLRGTLLECSLVGITLGLGLLLIGFNTDVAIAIGIVAGITNAIPFLGPAIGLGVGLGYGLVLEEIDPIIPFITTDNLFIAIFVCVLIAQLLDNMVFQPIVLGSAVNLHPLVVIIGVMGGSVIFGFAGMLLAIPSIVIFKVIIETLFKELKAYRII
jgi:predicted PurR-regulated permease PerM